MTKFRINPAKVTIVPWLCLLLVVANAPVAIAQDATPGVGGSDAQVQILVRPVDGLDGQRLETSLEAGQSQNMTVMIGNAGTDSIALRTYTSDLYTKINGGLGLNPEGTEQHEPTTWIDYDTETFDLAPSSEVAKDFTVTVPDGTPSGQYVVPIAVQTVDSFAIEGNEQLRQVIRKVVPIYITVPGDLAANFELGEPVVEFISGSPVIQVPVDNTGSLRIRLQGEFAFADNAGNVLLSMPVQMGAIYVNTNTVLEIPLSALPPAGDYLVTLTLTEVDTGVTQSFEDRTLVVPEPQIDEAVPLQFSRVTVEANAEPIQFATVTVEVANIARVYKSARLTLIVTRGGEPVEEFVLADNVTLNQGVTTVQQRYLPIDGWSAGSYSFSLRLESTENGAVEVLLTQDDVATIEVP